MPELNWVGKNKVVTHHMDVPYRVLDMQYTFNEANENVAGTPSDNLVIHGDNLEALKALLPRYGGKADCIYIDPPYNTGNEGWVYNDKLNDPRVKRWLGHVVGKEGDDLSRHDKWLCMMYPRLRLLHRLLSPRGVILMSIDDHEYQNLKAISDQIFGSNNHLTTFVWEASGHTDNQGEITHVHEYILAYAKNIDVAHINSVVDPNVPEDSKIRRSYAENSVVKNGKKNPPSIITLPAGFPCSVNELNLPAHDFAEDFINECKQIGYISRSMKQKYPVQYPLRLDNLEVKDGALVSSCRVFTGWMNATKLQTFIEAGCEDIKSDDEIVRFYLNHTGAVYYRKDGRSNRYVQSVLRNMGTTETSSYLLESMGINFDYPKPIELIQYLLSTFLPEDGLALDSFAGSGTTAHAVLNLNRLDAGNRKFILIELEDYAESGTAQRVKKAISGFTNKKTSISTIFKEELTMKTLSRAHEIIERAKLAALEAQETHSSVGRPKIAIETTGGREIPFVEVVAKETQDHYTPGTGGDFSYYELGNQLLLENAINPKVAMEFIREYIWRTETGNSNLNPVTIDYPDFLGRHERTSYFVAYSRDQHTVLDRPLLAPIPEDCRAERYVIYADTCTLSDDELDRMNIVFKKIPRDIAQL